MVETLTSHRGALVQLLDLPLQLLDPTLSLAGMYITIRSTCRTRSLGGCRGIRHSRASSNESGGGGRERRSGRSGHDNMGVYPEIFKTTESIIPKCRQAMEEGAKEGYI